MQDTSGGLNEANTPEPPPFAGIRCASLTHPGLVRRENEDTVAVLGRHLADQLAILACIGDGLGGHHGGGVASQIAVEVFRNEFLAWDGTATEQFLRRAVQRANAAVFQKARACPELAYMQTTLTAAIAIGGRLVVAHVGDCRLYRFRTPRLEVLTHDHTLVMEMLRMRMITPDQATDHSGRYQLTRSVGSDLLLQPDVYREEMLPGDTYLLCSDGLWGELTSDDIREALEDESPDSSCRRLLAACLENGGPDNVTSAVLRVDSVPTPAPAGSRWRSLLRRRPLI